jgi:hypothetical protein
MTGAVAFGNSPAARLRATPSSSSSAPTPSFNNQKCEYDLLRPDASTSTVSSAAVHAEL